MDVGTMGEVLEALFNEAEKCSWGEVTEIEIVDLKKRVIPEYLDRLEIRRLAQSENDADHSGYMAEQKLLECVRTGNTDELLKGFFQGKGTLWRGIGVMSEQLEKQVEYMLVTNVVLCTRAAVEGGVSIERAYEMSDILLQDIASAKSKMEQMQKCSVTPFIFAEMVRQQKERTNSPCVSACKAYIGRNLRKNFRVSDIADAIGVSTSYLSRRFSEEEHMTVIQYIGKERLEHAANLLRYSNYEITTISEYFCFSSHSHFSAKFKKRYGISPSRYRELHRNEDVTVYF